MTLDPSRFSAGVKCKRIDKAAARVEGEHIIPTRDYKTAIHVDQVLIETPEYWLVTPNRVHGITSKVYDVSDTTWSAPTAFALVAGRAAPTAQTRLLDAHVVAPLSSYQFDKVLDILVEMGRVDVAFELVCEHLDMPGTVPTSWVIFERFAHRSPLVMMTSPNTAVRPEGSVKRVIEHMFILSGGWHGRKFYRDPTGASEVMLGVRNPWRLAGVVPGDIRLDRALHSVYKAPDPIVSDGWEHNGVVYMADTDGAILPYWYGRGAKEAAPAWDEAFRRKTASSLGLSIMLARNIERSIASSAAHSLTLTSE